MPSRRIRCLALAAGLSLSVGAHADDSDWKLRPLKYNNPGLVVDLGVGLWAWPMPMDYDGDGDMDLLVACPDKPSNGVYYFENPTQDPEVKMPVFKPGVRIGKTTHNFQVSYVGGQPRILKPGYEFPRDEKTGKFDFEKPKKIYPRTNIHENPVRANMWRYADYDGDGDHDLVVGVGDWTDYGWDHAYDSHGRWRNGPLHGYVYLIENEGSDAEPEYSDEPRKLTAGGGLIDVYGWPSPNFADFDGDDDLDLLCGEFLDGFTYFENVSEHGIDRHFAAGERVIATDGRPLTMDLQMITPTAFDWDQDGDLDLIVGDEDGRVALIENDDYGDAEGVPMFKQPVYFRQEADTLKFGALATPFAYDWDNDGDEDILCGNTAGYIGFFENLGKAESGLPKWAAPKRITTNGKPFRILAGSSGSIQGPCEAKWGYTTFSVGDFVDSDTEEMIRWNRERSGLPPLASDKLKNGPADIVGNSIHGKWFWLRQKDESVDVEVPSPLPLNLHERAMTAGKTYSPRWSWKSENDFKYLSQWRTTPVITRTSFDFSKTDAASRAKGIVGLDHEGYLTIVDWLNFGSTPAPPNPVNPTPRFDPPEYFGEPERVFLDEDLQPLRLNARSCGRSGRIKLAVVDWDGDGRLDVLTNSENATWYRNCQSADHDRAILKKIGNLAKRNVAGHTSSPAACDFDGNGKPDLLVGAENGRIYHIKHEDCIEYPDEKLKARPPKKIPPPRFPGLVSEGFVFTRAKFPQCHASTICETTRGLVVAWFGGTREKARDVGIWVSYDDGGGWSAPKEWANGVQHDSLRHPCWNPVLFQPPGDAPTLLFFKVGPDPRTWWGEMMVSYDRGRTFRERRRLPETIDGPVRCKPILLSDGETLLSGSSTESDGWTVHFEKTKLSGGQPRGGWKRIGPINTKEEFNAIQPTFLRHRDGTLQVLCRTQEGVVSTSFSQDDGETWSAMEATNLPNPNAGVENVTLKDGRHLLIYNHTQRNAGEWRGRNMLNLAISDDGKSWKKVAVLEREKGAEFSYPAIIQTEDGLVHMTYTWKRQRIKHVMIDPAKIRVGEGLGTAW